MSKRRALLLIQWSVSIILVWYLLSKVELAGVLNAVRHADAMLLLISLVQLAFQPLLGAMRWKLIVHALDSELHFATSLRFVWIGTFFSQVLPGAVGGDVVRIWLCWRAGVSRRLAVNSVAIERIIMMLSLLILVAVIQPELVARSRTVVATWLPPLMLAAAVFGVGILMLSDRMVKRYSHWLPFRAITYLAVDSRKTLLRPVIFTAVTLISILAYLNMAITAWLIALALGLTVSLPECFVLMPVVLLAATIPISVGGWGVREGAMIMLFATAGVSSTDALTLSVLFGLTGILVSLPGVAIWLCGGYRRSDLSQAAALANNEAQKNRNGVRRA